MNLSYFNSMNNLKYKYFLKITDMKTEINPDHTLDCIGFFCPEPLFQTRQEIDNLNVGEILEVLANDPAAKEDLTRFCKRTGNELLKLEEDGDEFRFLIKKK